jgi:hypothetical protein
MIVCSSPNLIDLAAGNYKIQLVFYNTLQLSSNLSLFLFFSLKIVNIPCHPPNIISFNLGLNSNAGDTALISGNKTNHHDQPLISVYFKIIKNIIKKIPNSKSSNCKTSPNHLQ